jgi:hypothetical protein
MATRNRYVKLALFEACPTNLMGSTVVGQYGETLLVERPQPKPRAAAAKARKPRATNAKAPVTAQPANTLPLGAEASRG